MSKLNGAFSRLLRLERAFPEFPEEVHRPAIFSLLFWSGLMVSYLFWALDLLGTDPDNGLFGVGQGSDLVPGTLAAGVLVVVWLFLPWDPQASRRRKLAAPTFLVSMFVMDRILPGGAALLYPIAFANGVFLFGFRRGIAYAAATLAVIFADGALTVRLTLSSPTTWGLVIVNTLLVVAVYEAVAVFVIGICMSIIEAHRRREETKSLLVELENAHAELKVYTGKARELAVSEERARMSREMHDSVGHYLTAINFQLEAAAKAAESEQSTAVQPLQRARKFNDEAFLEVRRSVRALRSPPAGERSGTGAMAALARSFEGTSLDVRFVVEGEEKDLTEEAELALYRTLQEGLSNAARHSDGRVVLATLAYGPVDTKLVVADDGKGNDGSGDPGGAVAEKCGFGLPALKERAEALGAPSLAATPPKADSY